MHQVWTVCRAFAAAAALVSCWSGVAAAQADKMTFRIGVQSDLKFLDPIVTPSRVTSQFANSVYETLFNQDINGVPRPQMVGDYKVSDDKLTYTFTLRPGLKWHSGGKVTSADVVVSLKRWMGFDPVGRKLNEFTASLEAVDADTFKLTLKRPYGLVLQSFAKPSPGSPFIMPERLAQRVELLLTHAYGCTAEFTQWAAVEALRGSQAWVAAMVAEYRRRRDRLVLR